MSVALTDAWAVRLEECLPVRGFPSYKGQRNRGGRWYVKDLSPLVRMPVRPEALRVRCGPKAAVHAYRMVC